MLAKQCNEIAKQMLALTPSDSIVMVDGVPIRQWVLTVPWPGSLLLARKHALCKGFTLSCSGSSGVVSQAGPRAAGRRRGAHRRHHSCAELRL